MKFTILTVTLLAACGAGECSSLPRSSDEDPRACLHFGPSSLHALNRSLPFHSRMHRCSN